MLALNCGYDTDCTCSTAGAILGTVYGSQYLMGKYGFTDTGYVLGVEATRRSNLIHDLAEDTCRIGLSMAMEINKEVEITDYPEFIPISHEKNLQDVEIRARYGEIPKKWVFLFHIILVWLGLLCGKCTVLSGRTM
jgi:hypothetical protein